MMTGNEWKDRFERFLGDRLERFKELAEEILHKLTDGRLRYDSVFDSIGNNIEAYMFVGAMFTWSETTEGQEYWQKIDDDWCKSILGYTIDSPIDLARADKDIEEGNILPEVI